MNMRTIGVMAAGIVALTAFTGVARSQCPPELPPSAVMIEFDANTFAYETTAGPTPSLNNPVGFMSTPGNVLTIVSIIDKFYSPLAYLTPSDPLKEYTLVITNLISLGTTTVVNGPSTIYTTNFSGGTFEIWEDSPEDAPQAAAMSTNPALGPTVPTNFQNGDTKILTGTTCGFYYQVTKTGPNTGGNWAATYQFTNPNAPGPPPAGNKFNQVGDGAAHLGGVWCVRSSCVPATYSAHPNGKFDSPPTTTGLRSTWGTLKQLYR